MRHTGLPERQGLYDPQFEHDACGIGFLAHIKGKKSHAIVQDALHMLRNLDHRGGQGDEPSTGDGAGILLQIPHAFLDKVCTQEGISLPGPGEYGVGMIFLPHDQDVRHKFETIVERIVAEEGHSVLGWRTVPVENHFLGQRAKAAQPFIRQVFIARGEAITDEMTFERRLYVIRRRAENEIAALEEAKDHPFYVASLSSRTIVYKGMLTSDQLDRFYLDLKDPDVTTAVALVHSRFSTNTFPSWERAHPNRYTIHNGEFNTLKGNVNWMYAREAVCESPYFGEDMKKIRPVIDQNGSDSAMFDNALEFLMLSGRSLAHAVMMMIPEPWQHDAQMDPEKRAFYEYHSCLMEPWDGPAAIAFTDGKQVGACLDRNGLRPARYYVTKDDRVIMSSEVGVLDIPEENIVLKERLHPGHMLLVDLEEGRIVSDKELKQQIATEHPYQEWLNEHLINLDELPAENPEMPQADFDSLTQRQNAFGYTKEELDKMIKPMVTDGEDPVGSMGYDAPLAVLSKKPQLLYNYFKQMFAQVTNPPIDAIREEVVTAVSTTIGPERNLLHPEPESCRHIRLETPILTNEQLARLKANTRQGLKAATLPITFPVSEGEKGLEKALDALFKAADEALENGISLLILSDRGIDAQHAAIPALLAAAGLHHHLIRQGTRTKASIIVESGEPREVHHFCVLLGYGTDAINPYLAFESIAHMVEQQALKDTTVEQAIAKYIKAATKGILKVISKMGISTIQSYKGAQIFEAIGIAQSVIDKYFTWTTSRLGGIDLETIAKEALLRHERGYGDPEQAQQLDNGDDFQFRRNGDTEHMFEPKVIHQLQKACRNNDYEEYKKYAEMVNGFHERQNTLRGLLKFKKDRQPVPLDEVESVESICRRFKTGAMSYGALSKEAHEALAIAMNRIGGKSNSGEGGEDPARFTRDKNGDWRRSAIKQVASGRFGVTSHYLTNADEIQIKMAQGAKPGEGGQLPGNKVYPWIAEVRGSTPGVGLISPPPHHDIYSIEDLAQLIHDLKNANPQARISVKLVSEAGVGTVAAGVAKGRADTVLISGYDGGTGAAAKTSIKHAGLPWELGLAETHQTLVLNNLRDRIAVETDGKMMTGRDVVIATLLGAEEYGFSTAPLVVLGCVMARVCHLNTCPVGVATQDPKLRERFKGDPQYIVNYMRFVAQEVRELMAQLGFRTIDEMVGRTDVLEPQQAIDHWKAKGLDLSPLLYQPPVEGQHKRYNSKTQDHGLDQALDNQLIELCQPALERQEVVEASFPIKNTNRVVGTMLGHEVTKRYGAEGLPEDTIRLHFTGSAGQSFGAFLPKGITLTLEGDANDYFGKGLSGGKLIAYPSPKATFKPEENIIIGNVAFYGATGGEAYIRGVAGERFCVRNSGARVVVEGVGDHGCEYMTGGRVVILGPTGKNFAAGMSGGIAYVLDENNTFKARCNTELIEFETLQDPEEIKEVKTMIEKHVYYTGSEHAKKILKQWDLVVSNFVKVIPKDYKRMIETIARVEQEQGLSGYEAALAAFEKVVGTQTKKKTKKQVAVSAK
ncbi:ferredoxin-dependent glutamate synthase [Caldalkalibacillus thermarum TA2.A1]|uniref:Ferredoxin-dependent glutamate synthase n=1 Tax=Caldalkalibacillus thermarum (strain TA2.A1) TaxID=986075 RepID=F5L3X1_CALTT|nr:glutamate synthase large subunit [Caldalkalibacillus thermarum]EGL83965.1 ferredoxin-dependent glutamate synthase [Caldalkalibacillus thermarum TA2.A1]QZT34681.1 glutamate synthase large subunit [Caldalkalibacillus thermarum TA2.A1]